MGQGGPVDSQFEPCAEVPRAGVLLSLPALPASGLWQHTDEHFELPAGYYQRVHVFLLVAFLALARLPGERGQTGIQALEGLRY